jgi:uncharacterized protein
MLPIHAAKRGWSGSNYTIQPHKNPHVETILQIEGYSISLFTTWMGDAARAAPPEGKWTANCRGRGNVHA